MANGSREQVLKVGPPLGGIDTFLPASKIENYRATQTDDIEVTSQGIRNRPPLTQVGDSLEEPIVDGRLFETFDGEVRTVVIAESDIYWYDNAEKEWVSIIDPEGSLDWYVTLDEHVDTAVYTNTLIITSKSNPILEWDGESDYVSIVTEDYQYRNATVFQERLVYSHGLEDGSDVPQRVRWTDIGTYDDFDSGRASFVDLVDTPGKILAMKRLGDELAIYKEDSIVLAQYSGGVSVYNFSTRIGNLGLYLPRGIVSLEEVHYFISPDNVYRFIGGREPEPIGNPVKSELLGLLRSEYADRVCTGVDGQRIWFAVPIENTYPDNVFVYDQSLEEWYSYSFPATAITRYRKVDVVLIEDLEGTIGDQDVRIGDYGSVGSVDNPLVGDHEGNVKILDRSYSEAVSGKWISKEFTLGEDYMTTYNRLRYIEVIASGESVTMDYSSDRGNAWNRIGTVELSSRFEPHRLFFDTSAQSVRFRFTSEKMRLKAFVVAYRVGADR